MEYHQFLLNTTQTSFTPDNTQPDAMAAPPSQPAKHPSHTGTQPPQAPAVRSSAGLRYPSNKKTIYDRNLNRSKNAELSRAAFAYLFVEMISYAQRRVTGIQDLERRCGPKTPFLRLRSFPMLSRPALD